MYIKMLYFNIFLCYLSRVKYLKVIIDSTSDNTEHLKLINTQNKN